MSLHLLVVDDDPAGLLALSTALQRHLTPEVVVDTAPGAESALKFLSVKPYDLVITDVRMAQMDGIRLLQEVRRRYPTVPVIVFTAAGRAREREALGRGAAAFLDKPIDLEQLLPVVESVLKRTELARRTRSANITSALNLRLKRPESEQPSSDEPPPSTAF